MGGNASRDAKTYRDGYPDLEDDPTQTRNVEFYSNRISSDPDGARIDDIHANWRRNYDLLERHHGYIQWLFPIREDGMNMRAQRLMQTEAAEIASHQQARVLESYRLMLDFYGMELVNAETGEVGRSAHWRSRYANLQVHSHNYLRLTRILKSLGELGLEHLKPPLVDHLLHEALETRALSRTRRSAEDYWLPVLRSDEERHRLAEKYDVELNEEGCRDAGQRRILLGVTRQLPTPAGAGESSVSSIASTEQLGLDGEQTLPSSPSLSWPTTSPTPPMPSSPGDAAYALSPVASPSTPQQPASPLAGNGSPIK